MRPSANPAAPSTAAANDDFTTVVSRHHRHSHSSQHSKRSRLPPQDEHKQHRLSFDDKPPLPPPLPASTAAISSHSPASSRRSSRASNPRKNSYDDMDEDGEWDSGLAYDEKHNDGSNSGSSRRQRLQSNADSYDGAVDYDEYDDTIASDDSSALECPLCMEQLDPTDLAFHPCMCGYQVCLYCYNNILDNLNGQCPACRREYDRSLATTASLAQLAQPTVIQQAASERKDKKRIRERERRKATQHDRNTVSQQQQAQLSSVRIIQRNLVYICGLPPGAAYEDWLRKREWFGRFGKITKGSPHNRRKYNIPVGAQCSAVREQCRTWICHVAHRLLCCSAVCFGCCAASVTKRSGGSHDALNAAPSSFSSAQRSANTNVYSAYVTYKSASSAASCIAAMHLSNVMGSTIRCTYGTTKYCAFFVRGQPCTNTACLYLHELAKPEDCVGKDELTEERLGYATQAEKLERQSSASSQHSLSAQSLTASNTTSTPPSAIPTAQSATIAAVASAGNVSSPRPSSAGSSCSSSSSSPSASQATIASVTPILNLTVSSSSSQPVTSFPFPLPAPTRSVSEGWAAVAAAGAAASQSQAVDAEDMLPVASSSVSSVPALLATAPLPSPTWAAVPSTTSAAALLSQAIQAEKERESADARDGRELRQPSATQPLPSATSAAEATLHSPHTTGSVIRRPPPGFEKMAGWSSQPSSTSTPPPAPSDDSSFFSMFAFPPPVPSAGRSPPPHPFSAPPLPPLSHDQSLHPSALVQPTFRSITATPPVLATEAGGPTWDFNAFVEQLRVTTSNLQPMPFADIEEGATLAAARHRDALQKVLFASSEPYSSATSGDSPIRQTRSSGSASLSSGSALDSPLFPAPLHSITQQLSELSAFSSLLHGPSVASASPSLSLSTDASGGLSADTDDDWSARADRVDGFDVSFAVVSPRAPYKPSGFDDSPPLTAFASLRHSLPPPPLALLTPTTASTAPPVSSVSANHHVPPTIRILTPPTEVADLLAMQRQQDSGGTMNGDDSRKDAASTGSHSTLRNGRHRKGSEPGERGTSNRDSGRRNHSSPVSDGNNHTSKKAPLLSLAGSQSKQSPSNSSPSTEDSAAVMSLSFPAPVVHPAVSTPSPILQLKRAPSSADKQTSPASPGTPSAATNVAGERSVDTNCSSGVDGAADGVLSAAPATGASPKPILSLAPRRNGPLVRHISDPRVQSTPHTQPQLTRGLSQLHPNRNHDRTESTPAAEGPESERSMAFVGSRPPGRTTGRAHNGRQQRAHGGDNNSGSGSASPVRRYSTAPSTSAFTSPPLVRLSLSKGLSSLSLGAADSHASTSEPPPLIAPSHSPHIVDRPAAVFDTITPTPNMHIAAVGNSAHQHSNGRHATGNRDRERLPRGRDRDRYTVRDELGEAEGQHDRRGQSSLPKR